MQSLAVVPPFPLAMSPKKHGPDAVIGLADLTTDVHPDLAMECGTIGSVPSKRMD
jgi:hypothetical protein